MNIILIGFKSCGKSTVGQTLAEHLTMGFVDTDTILEQCHADCEQEYLPCREIYRRYGKSYFRSLEKQVIDQLGRLDNHVVAIGGGTFIHSPITPEIQDNSRIFYLEVTPAILAARIKAGGVPTFFKGDDFEQEFRRLFCQREPIYRDIADYTINVSTLDVQSAIIQIVEHLGWEGHPIP